MIAGNHVYRAALIAAFVGYGNAPVLQAASLNFYDQLTLDAGVYAYDSNGNPLNVSSGSYFGIDFNNDGKISGTEKLVVAQGTTGIRIGLVTSPGASHSGYPTAGDTNEIDAPWSLLGNTGSTYTTVGISGSTTAGLDMSGWTITWNSIPAINMGSGAWGAGYSDGMGNFVWSGIYGAAYSLDYRATVPTGDPSGFGDVPFQWHLEGVVMPGIIIDPIPIPAAIWLLCSGLLGLLGLGRRGHPAP